MPQKDVLPPLKETYKKDDKNPFGAYQAFNLLLNFFQNVRVVYGEARTLAGDSSEIIDGRDHSLYIIVADRLFFSEEDADWLFNYVKDGNELFISSNEIDPRFLKLFDCETNQKMAHLNDRPGQMQNTSTSIFFGNKIPLISYSYFYYPFTDYIKTYQKDNCRIMGMNERSLPNYAIFFAGKGRLYLHLAPRAFGNYFILTDNNRDYISHILSYFKEAPSAVYWDEYYKKMSEQRRQQAKDEKDFNTLKVIIQNPLLKWAFWIMIAGFIFFLFSNAKRKQRVIPVVKRPVNASVDFVETMGRLYFVNKDNKNIATKLIIYFREFIRSRYFLRGIDNDEEFAKKLSAKRGIPPAQAAELLNCIRHTEQQEQLSDHELLHLNLLLEKFYKK